MATEKREDETQTAFAVRIVKEEGAAEFADELRTLLAAAGASLSEKSRNKMRTAADRDDAAIKAQGIRIALDILDEMTRGL